MSSFFIKILPGGTEGGDFYKNPQGLNFTALYADLSLLCFFGFCRLVFSILFLLFSLLLLLICGRCGGKSRKKRLRLKGWTVAANSGGTERFADTGQASRAYLRVEQGWRTKSREERTAVDGTCRSGGLACVFAFSGKNHDSPERTTRGYRFNSQSGAEANKTNPAEARSDPQASQTRQPVDF